MEVRIYSCPRGTGWFYCEVQVQQERLQTMHWDVMDAYRQCQHLDKPGVDLRVDVAGLSLKKLRERAKP